MRVYSFLFMLVCGVAKAQYLAPYSDVLDQVYMFEDGYANLIEPLPLKGFKVGKHAMLYSSPQGRLKAYFKGAEHKVMDITPDYFTTDNWVGYYNFGTLAILEADGDRFKIINGLAQPTYWVSDSLVVYESTLNETIAYYKGENTFLEQWAVPDTSGVISDNIFAYKDRANNFKIFYHGEQILLEGYTPESFRVDRDIVMYKDFTDNFKVYSKGQSYETAIPYRPNYYTGEGFFVFYDNQNRLNIWYDGEVSILSQSPPRELLVKENIVAFTDQGNNFYGWYKGKLQLLERFQPLSMKADNDILVYQGQYGRLMGLYYGNQIPISTNIVQGESYKLYNETVVYSLVRGETTVWSKGKTYTYR